jgi:hypothetical protein
MLHAERSSLLLDTQTGELWFKHVQGLPARGIA